MSEAREFHIHVPHNERITLRSMAAETHTVHIETNRMLVTLTFRDGCLEYVEEVSSEPNYEATILDRRPETYEEKS